MHSSVRGLRRGVALAVLVVAGAARAAEMPRLVEHDGRHALLVDGAPYLVLGAQINNSSGWPAVLDEVWPALEAMHVNTAEAPVYWEATEPREGSFDFSNVDALVNGARAHHLRLVLLWFGTWKNGNMHYAPEWVKADTKRFPRMLNANGEPLDVLSAHGTATRDADAQAFAAVMRHVKQIDSAENTVIMVQVENESGAIGTPRDFSAESNRAFAGAVPDDLVRALKTRRGTWSEVFDRDANEVFQAYAQAKYVNMVVEAGKREFPLPMYCNVWLSYPVAELPERQVPNPGIGYPSGGPVQNRIGLWKAFAPAVDAIGPDIYADDTAFYNEVLDTYARRDNPLWIPETGEGDSYAKFLFAALGRGAIGFSPFGVDWTGWTLARGKVPEAHAQNFALLGPMQREIAQLSYDGKLKTAVETTGAAAEELDFGAWKAAVRFGFPQHDGRRPPGTEDHHGRALVAQLGPNEFLVTGVDASVAFHTEGRLPGLRMEIVRAEEGSYVSGTWLMRRLWNGDQTDRGLNFRHEPFAVRVTVRTF